MMSSKLYKISLLIVFIFLVSNGYAKCDEGQIDINIASKTELDKLSGIGPAKATEIINSRPFESLDDLLNVKGIGEATLQSIKDQGLACVENETKTNDKETNNDEEQNIDEENIEDEVKVLKTERIKLTQDNPPVTITNNIIKLDSKSIKSQTNSENSTKRYATYGLIFFCILLSILFMINRKKIFAKNEFN